MGEDVKEYRLIHITTIPLSLLVLINGQIHYMKSQGFDIHTIASPSHLSQQFRQTYQVPLYDIPMTRKISPILDFISLVHLWLKLWQLKPDIVHSHTPKAGLLGMIASWLARVPVRIYHLHGLRYATTRGFKRQLLILSEKLACRLAHQVISVSYSVQQSAIDANLVASDKIVVLANGSINGVDSEERFNPRKLESNVREIIRQEYNIPINCLVIGSIGRIVRDKGLIEMVEVWHKLSTIFPDLHWLIAGTFEDEDPVPANIRRQLEQDTRIHLIGFVDNHRMPEILTAIDVLAFPSHREGFPVTLLEASAMEIPIVTTNATGCVDAVVYDVTGMIVNIGDISSMTDALERYLTDKDLREKHGKAGRERVVRDFSQDCIWQALLENYQQLIECNIK